MEEGGIKAEEIKNELQFIFSSLDPHPKIIFKYDNPQASAYIQEPNSTQIRCSFHSSTNHTIHIELTKGVLTLQYCDKLLQDLLKCKDLSLFKKPVNAEKEGIKGYYDVIKNPMDLTTLQNRLYTGLVTSVSQFKSELDLIWENCINFNGPGNSCTILAQEIQKIVNQIWYDSIPPVKSDAVQDLQRLDTILSDLDKTISPLLNMEELRNRPEIPHLKKIKTAKIQPPKEEPKQKIPETPPNRVQLKLMSEKLSNTPPSDLKAAWDILKVSLKNLDPKKIREEQTISLDHLPEQTLIDLKKILLSA
ncbi:Bromodomain containing protein [Histomonas meleagridis]|uniref:Bromodomain containing protein n=1 Tax=Histomonas meleagridis TaxID=135588 RepID=UPI0035594750|nr:Bromodomain containing protein [Histomonas meleagridis]KAH0801707.1 Bromodomain containing protein [Histomonas meleagridis]